MKLTPLETKMYRRLIDEPSIARLWASIQETKALNRLVKKGYASYNNKTRRWTLAEGE
ncbi:MAG: hypothetical protein GY941_30855 [Planctomycetes bacterium]|nr:hypothetical protein [Planctomycetota bacterium]